MIKSNQQRNSVGYLWNEVIGTIYGMNKMIKGEVSMAVVSMEVPEEMVAFALPGNREEQLEWNAMILYPYVRNGMIFDTTPIIFLLKVRQFFANNSLP